MTTKKIEIKDIIEFVMKINSDGLNTKFLRKN